MKYPDVEVILISQAGTHGVVSFNGRKYLIEIGWLDAVDVAANKYTIHIGYLTSERLVNESK